MESNNAIYERTRDAKPDVYSQLPSRQARNDPVNILRVYMYPLLLHGYTREDAEKIGIAKLKERGYPTDNLKLEYRSK